MIKHDVWSAMTFYIGQEIDDLFYKKALEQSVDEDGEIKLSKRDLNDLYFRIKERIERGVNIEEPKDVKVITINLNE